MIMTEDSGVRVITSDKISKPLANYSPVMKIGDLLFLAGQLASDFKSGIATEARVNSNFPYYGSSIKSQTKYILENIRTLLSEAGSSLDHVVKAQVFLADMSDFSDFDEIWGKYFTRPPPRTTVGTSGLLTPGALIEIDLIAVVAGD
jgi:reactive intermediate/imine deaminase